MKYIWSVMRGKLLSRRLLTLMLLLFYIVHLYLRPLMEFSRAVDYKSSPWSYAFLFTNMFFLFLFAVGIAYLFSDVPFLYSEGMFQIVRVGRRKWVVGQIAGIFFQSFFLMAYIFGVSVFWLLGRCQWTGEWGKLLHTLAMTNAGEYFNMPLIYNYEAMSAFTPIQMTLLTFLLGGLVCALIGMIMFVLSLFWSRAAGVVAGAAAAVLIFVVENCAPNLVSLFSRVSPYHWMRTAYTNVYLYGTRMMPPLSYIFPVLTVSLIALCLLALWRMRTVELQWSNEE